MNAELKILQNKYSINLFDWFTFDTDTHKESESSILILGDVEDTFVLPLAKRVKNVVAILESEDCSRIYDYINIPSNVKILGALIKEGKAKINEKLKKQVFDYVLIPEISDDICKILSSDLKELIDIVIMKFTGGKGKVLLAFDNSESLNVIGGEKLEQGIGAYSYKNIKETKKGLLEKYKNLSLKVYFPMPEYKFPLRIYSEDYLPKLEDEDKMTRNLVERNLFNEYAPSYIVVFESDKVNRDENTIYVKYNLNRTKKFALRTSIVATKKGVKKVIKKAQYEEANDHVKEMLNSSNIIHNKNIEILKPLSFVDEKDTKDNLSYITYPFIDGEMLTDVIIKEIKDKKNQKEIINKYMNMLIGKESGLIENYNLDCTFQNAIKDNGKIIVFDSEWVTNETTEVNFLKYRILKYFYNSNKQDLKYNSFDEIVEDFDIDKNDAKRYESAENEFQSRVHENINNLDIEKYNDNRTGFQRFNYLRSELERKNIELDITKSKLEHIVGTDGALDFFTRTQNEQLRLKNVHIANLEAMIVNLRNENGELGKQVHFFHKRESVIFKILRKIKNTIKKMFPSETIPNKILKYIYRIVRHPIKMLKTIFTKSGRNRIIGDMLIGDVYFECGKVQFKKFDKPKVSIIIPCFNQVRYTYKCLYSIMKNASDEIPFEVILADDVSTDTTKNIKKYVDNIVISRNETNLGFLKNCNKAAKLAKGDYIYFLNNDTEVKPNFLKSLVDRIESDITIGMVGSKLIFADGTLQEAGGIIWSDGTGANYGRGDDPENFKYNYVREVDYISGAAIMIRKSLWDDIGGFDELYTPAYCEDSDLAFEVRKRGFKVVYEPLSQIIHYEGISNGKDTSDITSIKSYQVENNKKLKEKWENELMNHYPHTDEPNFFKARERDMDKKIILFIDHYVPTFDKDAGSKTVFAYIKMFLKKGYRVKFLGDNFSINTPYGEVLQSLGVEVLYGNNLQATIWDYLKENKKNIDFIFLNRPHIAIKYINFIKENMDSKIIYYGHDLHYMRLNREYEVTHDENKKEEAKYYRTLEYSLLYQSDVSFYPSNVEVDEIKSIDESLKVKAITAYIYDKVLEIPKDFSMTKDLLFVGGFAHDPNVDALIWFAENIMPRIRARNPYIRLNVVGSNATDEVKRVCEENSFNLLGFVSDEDLMRLYDEARIVVAPLRYGAGIKGKIIEAMSRGSAIITTKCGAEGIENAEDIMEVAENSLDFSNRVIKLYDDFEKLNDLSIKTKKHINNNFTIDVAFEKIAEDFV